MSKFINIAIDGPSGAGKSTIAKAVAKRKACLYLDTGAMYRAYALYMMKNGIDFTSADGEEMDEAVAKCIDGFNISIQYAEDGQHVVVNGEDYTHLIRTPEVAAAASRAASVSVLRVKMVELQREIAGCNNVVMDGRDIGTHVLPDANVKIFLTASAEARAKRRYDELKLAGSDTTYQKVYENMLKRDLEDTTREISPLVCAEDAVTVDTTSMSLEESIDKILEIVEAAL